MIHICLSCLSWNSQFQQFFFNDRADRPLAVWCHCVHPGKDHRDSIHARRRDNEEVMSGSTAIDEGGWNLMKCLSTSTKYNENWWICIYVSILHYLTLFRVLSGMHRILWTTRRVCVVTIISYAVHMQFNILSQRNNRHQIPNSFWFTLLESFVSMKHELIWALFCSNPVFQFVPSLSAWVAILPATATHPHVSHSHRLRCQVPDLQAANVASSLPAHTIHLVDLIHKEILTHLTYEDNITCKWLVSFVLVIKN